MEKRKILIKKYSGTIFLFIIIFFAYYTATENQYLDPYLFPKISKLRESLAEYEWEMFANLAYSFKILIPGVMGGISIALALGIPMGMNKTIREMVHPVIYAVSMLPVILLSPFAIHMAPSLKAASIFLIVWGTVWSMLFATINGIMTIDKRYLDNAMTLELKGIKRFTKIILPAAMPSMAGGFINSLRAAFLSLIFAEMYGTKIGMGAFIKINSDLGRFQHVWTGFLFLAFVMVLVMQIVERTKDYLLRWTID